MTLKTVKSPTPEMKTTIVYFSFTTFPHDQFGKVSQFPVADPLSIHKHRRRPANTDFLPIFNIFLDQAAAGCRLAVLIELVHIQIHPPGDFQNFFIVELLVIVKQLAVKLPEFALITRSQRSHGALMGELMVGKREVLDHIADVIGEFFQHLLDILL